MELRERLIAECQHGAHTDSLFVDLVQRILAFDAKMPQKIQRRYVGTPVLPFVLWAQQINLPPTSGLRRFVLSLCAVVLEEGL